jgi:hypothetical protein
LVRCHRVSLARKCFKSYFVYLLWYAQATGKVLGSLWAAPLDTMYCPLQSRIAQYFLFMRPSFNCEKGPRCRSSLSNYPTATTQEATLTIFFHLHFTFFSSPYCYSCSYSFILLRRVLSFFAPQRFLYTYVNSPPGRHTLKPTSNLIFTR